MQNLGISIRGINLLDPNIHFNVKWIKQLLDYIKPLYNELKQNDNIVNN